MYVSGYFHMLCGNVCVVVPSNLVWCLMNVMHSWFYVMYHIFKTIPFLREVFVLSDVSPFRNLTFFDILARQVSSFCILPSFCVA